ncbi:hypothetical protein [Wolbachia endosymbiont (group A) of Pipizella viduata]|uniref:hypothetical protein n=1 Tax=Wolbachia endosymbiont (group A) of Pipizella viduata TaxID=3066154 RepID=UPI00333EE7B4
MDKKESSRTVKGGGRIDLSKIDPKYIDDYRDRFKQEDEEKARRNDPSSSMSSCNSQSSSKGSSRS